MPPVVGRGCLLTQAGPHDILRSLSLSLGFRPALDPPPPRPNCVAGFPVFDPLDSPAATSPLAYDAWSLALRHCPGPLPAMVLGMVRHGAKLGYRGQWSALDRLDAPNLPRGEAELLHVRTAVADRVRRGWAVPVAGTAGVVVSPIGTVPKPNGKWRTINHLSWPRRRADHPSINDGISCADVALAYDNLDGLLAAVRRSDGTGELWKSDLADAFFHVVVASRDSRLLGFRLDGVTYRDTTLNFGGRSSPFLFNLVAEALHWVLESLGLALTHYLDDFFGLAAAGRGRQVLDLFAGVCSHLGVSVAPSKCLCGSELEILGIVIDCRSKRAWISTERRAALQAAIAALLASDTADPQLLQSLAGSLNFVARVCPAGRAFMRRIYDAVAVALATWTPLPVRGGLRDELAWWASTLDRWDGVRILDNSPSVEIWTDAATSKGMGAHLGPREACEDAWALPIPPRHQGKDVLFLECLALLEAVRRWSGRLAGRCVSCKIDNMALVAIVRSGRCDQSATQALIRETFGIAIEHHIDLVPDWVPSKDDDVADALSRFDIPFLSLHRPHVLRVATIPSGIDPAPPADPALDVPDDTGEQAPLDWSPLLNDGTAW